MCGIVGYAGEQQVVGILTDSLSNLEYRGYDSAGISFFENGKITTIKTKGRLNALIEMLNGKTVDSGCGIGHTRWATHGAPSDVNAHPHTTAKLSLVHNGIIENYQDIKNMLLEKGYIFESKTDTETAAKLIDYYYSGNPEEAIYKAMEKIEGSFAFVIIFTDHPGTLYAVRRGSPLIVAPGNNGNFAASDIPAILKYTRSYILLEENELATVTKDSITIRDVHHQIKDPQIQTAGWTIEQAQKDGYPHFMLKEINEQPEALLKTIEPRIADGLPSFVHDSIPDSWWESFSRIAVIACGTAMHAGKVGQYLVEKLARIPMECDVASEFRYRDPILGHSTLVILISQSGETADTLAALRLAKQKGAQTLAIVNAAGSSIAREADYTILTYAGPEIAVASTKAYSVQMGIMYLVSFRLALSAGKITAAQCREYTAQLNHAVAMTKKVLPLNSEIKAFAEAYKDAHNLFFIGRGLDYYQSMEGALKMKEISYIHCESYAGGELKHGTISLITPETGVVALVTQTALTAKQVSNIKEVCARGADVLILAKKGEDIDPEIYSRRIDLPPLDDLFMPIVTIIPLQLLAYYTACARNCDVDKPRNLAKSVTVE